MTCQTYIILLLLTTSALSRNLQSSNNTQSIPHNITVETSSCHIHYQTQQLQNTILFYNCTVPGKSSDSWVKCLKLCCPSLNVEQYFAPSSQGIKQCQKIEEESVAIASGVIEGIAITLGFLVILLVICTASKCRCFTHSHNSNHQEPIEVGPSALEAARTEWQPEQDINTSIQPLTWSQLSNIQHPLAADSQPCTICLDNNITAQLVCGHIYHPKCIGLWLRKSNMCPCCRHGELRGVKIYCGQCRWRYYICTKDMLTVHAKDLPQICANCSVRMEEDGSKHNLSIKNPQRDHSHNKDSKPPSIKV